MGIIKREETIVFKHIFILFFNIFFQDISRFITAIAQKQGHTSAAGATAKFENTNPSSVQEYRPYNHGYKSFWFLRRDVGRCPNKDIPRKGAS